MARFLKLSRYFVNIDCIQLVEFCPDPPIAVFQMFPGYEEMSVKGEDALLLVDTLDDLAVKTSGIPICDGLPSD